MNETYASNRDLVSEPGDPGPVANQAEAPLERLEAQICELAGHLTAATCRFLLLVGDFDARRGWAEWDLPSCAAWLAWKCQIAPGTAREQVRVARALRELPVIRGEFAAGRMSYAKVRALTRIATPATEADLAEMAGPMTAGQLERFARAHRQVSSADENSARAARRVTWRLEDDGSLSMNVRLPAAEGAVVLQALRAAANDLEHPHGNDSEHPHADELEPTRGTDHQDEHVSAETPTGGSWAADEAAPDATSLADALAQIAGAFLTGKVATAANSDIYQVIVHVGPEALTTGPEPEPQASPGRPAGHPADPRRCHIEDGPAISPATAQRIACQASTSWMLHDHAGNLLDVGRRHRTPPPAQRRAVRERDRYRCQFPGCNSRRTDIHHIIAWAKGGKTRLRDLILLCQAHHVIVHELGYLITPASGGFAFTRPDGTPLPASPPLPPTSGDITRCHDAEITADTIVPNWTGEALDLEYAIWVAFANARLREEQAPAA